MSAFLIYPKLVTLPPKKLPKQKTHMQHTKGNYRFSSVGGCVCHGYTEKDIQPKKFA